MKKFLTTYLGGAVVALAMTFLPNAASALTISPPTFDFSLNPGDTVLDVIKIYNEGTEPIKVYPILRNFKAGDEEAGQPVFYPAEENPDGTALASWIKLDAQPMTIGPNERANLPFAINVPRENAQPGGHYGAILLSTQPPEEGAGKVSIGQQLGILVLVKVAGEVKEIGSISEFGFAKAQVSYNYLPVNFFVRFENGGNTHLRPTGNLFIKNWMGRQVASIKVNEDFKSVLPKSIRKFSMSWKNTDNREGWSEIQKEWHNFAFGKYKATLVLTYGSSNQLITDERDFAVWPWRLLIAFSVAALLIVVLFWLLMKGYNRLIIIQYERMRKNGTIKETPKPDTEQKK